jgi:hypothetical protein
VSLSPPSPAQAGQPYILQFTFADFETGDLTDPASLTLDLTYGNEAGETADIAGPFTFSGASAEASDTLWRLSAGTYAFRWEVPVAGLLPGVYVATWTAQYGPAADEFEAIENFPIMSGAPFTPVPSGDVGFWQGSITYAPSWSPVPLVITFGEVDASGVAWRCAGPPGGWDSPPAVGSVIQRSADHGGWAAPQYYGPRVLTLNCSAEAPTQALRDQARAQLQQILPTGTSSSDLATFALLEPVPKQVQVRRNGGSSIPETCPTLTSVDFVVAMVAPDMRKYSTQQQSASVILPVPIINPLALPFTGPVTFPGGVPPESVTITALNIGTFETRPSLVLTGPIAGPAIVNANTGQRISFSGLSMAATDVLEIDTDNRQCFLNNQFYPADPSSSWWVLQGGTPDNPGLTTVFVSGVTPGGAQLSMTWSSAWA